jgi:polyphosphate kinase
MATSEASEFAAADRGDVDPSRYFNRELSWLEFAARVLELAREPSRAPLSRARFLGIFSGGLDEFFQVRVAGLKDQLLSPFVIRSLDGRTPRDQLRAIRARLLELLEDAGATYDRLLVDLAREGVAIEPVGSLPEATRRRLEQRFEEELFPILTPLSVDPAHPFPYISNLSLSIAVAVHDPVAREERFARIKVPPNVRRLQSVGPLSFVLLEDVIAAFAGRLFPGMELGELATFRVTRNTDLVLEEGEAEDLLALVETELRRRRFGRAVRLELAKDSSYGIEALLAEELELHHDDLYRLRTPLDLSLMFELADLGLDDQPMRSIAVRTPPPFTCADDEPEELFAALREREVLVHHPYDSFSSTVERFVGMAARDPKVLAIKQTLYRTSGDSALIGALIEAAEHNKQVVVIVEVKARFDELANIGWARKLEEAGVHVVYGVVGLKTHCKAIMVVRRESEGLVRYCHLGTGNYNAKTARSYEDLGLFSADPLLGRDLAEVFNYLTGFSRPSDLERLVLSPLYLRTRLLAEISRETALGDQGRILLKVNSLVDQEIIDALYVASQAGVQVDGIVRGLCALRPGVPGLSERITIKSIVGEFLEHSRIFIFGDPRDPGSRMLIGSADLMPRNLDRRVELVVPVEAEAIRTHLRSVMELALRDDVGSWYLGPDGRWDRATQTEGLSLQEVLGAMVTSGIDG